MSATRRTVALAMVLAFAGCRSACSFLRSAARQVRQKPPMETVQREVPARLRNNSGLLSQLCGLNPEQAAPERVRSVTVAEAPHDLPGLGSRSLTTRVEMALEDGRVLVCTGVILVTFILAASDPSAPDGWRYSNTTLSDVSTPGVHWTPPAGGHHHHH